MQQTITSSRIRVIVGNEVFEIPSDKLNQLKTTLAQWQSIKVSENTNSPIINYNGIQLIHG